MEALAEPMKMAPETANKRRAVGEKLDNQIQQLAIAIAKTVVGLDGNVRRLRGVLETTAIVREDHPYLRGLQECLQGGIPPGTLSRPTVGRHFS